MNLEHTPMKNDTNSTADGWQGRTSIDESPEPPPVPADKKTYAKAKLPAEIEVYKAAHGWCPPDTRVYDAAQSERAWSRMLALFNQALV